MQDDIPKSRAPCDIELNPSGPALMYHHGMSGRLPGAVRLCNVNNQKPEKSTLEAACRLRYRFDVRFDLMPQIIPQNTSIAVHLDASF